MTSNFKLLIFIILSTSSIDSLADCSKEDHYCRQTNIGILEQQTKAMSDDGYSHLTLDKVEIYKSNTSYISFFYEDLGYIKSGKYYITKTVISTIPRTPCHHNEFQGFCSVSVVLDFSGDKPIISNEFISDSGQEDIDWVSWGKANSIIVFTDGSKFKYANGRVERVVDKK